MHPGLVAGVDGLSLAAGRHVPHGCSIRNSKASSHSRLPLLTVRQCVPLALCIACPLTGSRLGVRASASIAALVGPLSGTVPHAFRGYPRRPTVPEQGVACCQGVDGCGGVGRAPAISVVPVMAEPVRTSGTTVAGPTTSVCAMAPWGWEPMVPPYWLGVTSRTFSVWAAGHACTRSQGHTHTHSHKAVTSLVTVTARSPSANTCMRA